MSKFRLYLDLQLAQMSEYTERGSIRYTLEHAGALCRLPGLVAGMGLNPSLPVPAGMGPEIASFSELHWSSRANFERCTRSGPVAYHVMSPFAPATGDWVLPSFSRRPEVPLVVTLVDMTPLTSPDPLFRDPWIARRYRSRFQLIGQADLVLSISENTTREAIDVLGLAPERIKTIGAGVSGFFRPAAGRKDPDSIVRKEVPGITRPFILSVTGTWDWKNTHRLIEAFGRLAADVRAAYQLIVVCRLNNEYRLRWQGLAAQHGLGRDDVIFTDLISRAALRSLYQKASLFVFPSLYEGFGLPAAEAAACGCPTIVSNTSSMPEILQFREATFDPYDPQDMANLIHRSLSDEGFAERLISAAQAAASRHTWRSVAERTKEAVGALSEHATRSGRFFRPAGGAGAGARPSARRLRLAMVASFDPGGASDPRTAIARELARIAELDLFSTGRRADTADELMDCPQFPLDALGSKFNPSGYDALVYPFRHDGDIEAVLHLFRPFPGVACLLGERGSFRLMTFGRDPGPCAEVGGLARGLVVKDPALLRLLEIDQGPLASMPPARVLPVDPGGVCAGILQIIDGGVPERLRA